MTPDEQLKPLQGENAMLRQYKFALDQYNNFEILLLM